MEGDAFRRGVAEFVGAFALTMLAGGAIMSGADLTGVALANGLVMAVMVSAVAHISGAHFNPAITLAFLVTRRIKAALAVVYWLSQFGGAIVAALLLWWIFPAQAVDGGKLGAPSLDPSVGAGAGVVLEGILTFFLVWVVFATVADARGTFKSIAGLSIGLTIAAAVLGGGRLTGAALNPARAFGPELVHNVWANAWIWYVGPFAGAVLAGLAYELLYLRPSRSAQTTAP